MKAAVTGVSHITISVLDVGRAFHFYVDVLGLEPVQMSDRSAYLRAGETWIALHRDEKTRLGQTDEYSHLAFFVDPSAFDEVAERIRASGADEWQCNATESESKYFLDPDHHRLEIHSSTLEARISHAKEEWIADVTWYV